MARKTKKKVLKKATKKKVSKRKTKVKKGTMSPSNVYLRYYLTCTEGTSNKFYDIVVLTYDDHYELRTTHGRIGTTGIKGKSLTFNSSGRAEEAADKIRREKLRKKYKVALPDDKYLPWMSVEEKAKYVEDPPLHLELEEESLERFSNLVFD